MSLFRVNTDTCYLSNTDGVGNVDEFLREGKVRRRPTGNVGVENYKGRLHLRPRQQQTNSARTRLFVEKTECRLNEAL